MARRLVRRMSNKIVFTGATGSIGSSMPISNKIIPLKIRIEDRKEKITNDLIKNASGTFIHLAAMTDKTLCEKYKNLCTKILISWSIVSPNFIIAVESPW